VVAIAFIGALIAVDWIAAKISSIITYSDPPRSMQELQDAVDVPRAGTEAHHWKMEQHVSKRRGMTQKQIDAPGNRVRISVLNHYEIVPCADLVQGAEAMRHADVAGQTVPRLVEQFRALALAKSAAIATGQNAKYTRLYWRLDTVEKELRSREGDQRRALIELYNHPNPQVRLDAAMATLVVFHHESRAALQMIIDRGEFPQAADAGHTLLYMSDGRFVPE